MPTKMHFSFEQQYLKPRVSACSMRFAGAWTAGDRVVFPCRVGFVQWLKLVELNSQTKTFHELEENPLTWPCVDGLLLCTTAGVVYDEDGQQLVSILDWNTSLLKCDNIHIVLYTRLYTYKKFTT